MCKRGSLEANESRTVCDPVQGSSIAGKIVTDSALQTTRPYHATQSWPR